jgi:hypothetical protein
MEALAVALLIFILSSLWAIGGIIFGWLYKMDKKVGIVCQTDQRHDERIGTLEVTVDDHEGRLCTLEESPGGES